MGNRGEQPRATGDMCPECGPGRPENDRIDYCICPPVDRIVGYASNPNDPGVVVKLSGTLRVHPGCTILETLDAKVIEGATKWLCDLRRHGPRRTK